MARTSSGDDEVGWLCGSLGCLLEMRGVGCGQDRGRRTVGCDKEVGEEVVLKKDRGHINHLVGGGSTLCI